MKKQILSIDLETYSDVDITKSGVYHYTESNKFEILLFAYAFDEEEVTCIDLTVDDIPKNVIKAIADPTILKTAFTASFEIAALSKYLDYPIDTKQWSCTMVRSQMLGLPNSLGMVAKALKQEEKKDTEGKALIRYFTKPCNPSKTNGGRTRNLPEHAPERWDKFISYCIQDVVVEREIRNKLVKHYVITSFERDLWILDQEINQRGVLIDRRLSQNAIDCDEWYGNRLMEKAKALTGLENPNSVPQLKDWLMEQTGTFVSSIKKEFIPDLLKRTDNLEESSANKVKQVLHIRQEMAKTSIKKYASMEDAVCRDNRIRGLLMYYGANRTGRWAGRLVQVQNLPQNKYKDLDLARNLLLEKRYEDIELLYDRVPNVLSQLIRTAFIAKEESRFIVADFSAIEARVIAYIADETWRLEVFQTHGKIYEASASQMFKVPIELITKDNPLRQKGKIAELALGYNGGAGALEQMGALKMGLNKEELPELVSTWRKANPNIAKLWKTINSAALKTVKEHTIVSIPHGIQFEYKSGILYIKLPSGRKLSYINAKIGKGSKFGNDVVTYEGMDQTTKQWCKQETYGGKLTENIVQAFARDCLAYSMVRVSEKGYPIVMHVHDEIIAEVPYSSSGNLEEMCEIMGAEIPWAKGLPLRADGYETIYYKKD